jgi:PAS domain-containing protein
VSGDRQHAVDHFREEPDGEYLIANAEFGRVIGIPPEELMGTRFADVFPAQIAALQRVDDVLVASDGEPVYGEAVMMRDRELRTYVTVTFALPDEVGVTVETCTIATDVTERNERDGERRERVTWVDRIESALAEDRMRVFAQPVVSLSSGERTSSELLVRMLSPGDEARCSRPARSCPPPSASG